jgi:hypothetical protein
VAKTATAAFATLVSLCSVAVGQKQSDKDKAGKQQVAISTKLEKDSPDRAKLTGTLLDQNGSVIARAEIKVINHQTKETESLRSNDEGQFSKRDLAPGVYDVIINSPGFKELKFELKVAAGETAVVEATLLVGELMGRLLIEVPISTPNTMIIKGDVIRKLPRP